MVAQIVSRFFKSLHSSGVTYQIPWVCTINQFKEVLRRECGRSDRNHHGFSVVTFEVGSAKLDSWHVELLAKMLKIRTRVTDILGWVDKNDLAVLLPETYAEGADHFVEHVRATYTAGKQMMPRYSVKTYPPAPSGPEDKGSGHNGREEDRTSGNPIQDIKGTVNQPLQTADSAHRELSSAHSAGKGSGMEHLDHPSILEIRRLKTNPLPLWKRVIDIIGSFFGLLILSPLMVPIAIFIKIVSPGPIFFKQERVGYLGRRITMWKFRTMHINNDTRSHQEYLANLIRSGENDDKPMIKQEDNPSIIPFGKILRAASIDELPQLINVLLGDMSLVGPRPPIPYEVSEYLRWHADRFETIPGMTGLWQVSGKNKLSFREMIRLDIRYARNLSFWQDLRILLKTVPVVISLVLEKAPWKLTRQIARRDDNEEAA